MKTTVPECPKCVNGDCQKGLCVCSGTWSGVNCDGIISIYLLLFLLCILIFNLIYCNLFLS